MNVNVNINQTLTQGLSSLSYNGDSVKTPVDHSLNIYMGMGLWSKKYKLSQGLPVDCMLMLLSARLMQAKINEANPGKSSKVILLIADSMAVNEGADKEEVSEIVQIYKKSLEPLLALLGLKNCSEIILSSDLEKTAEYAATLRSVKDSPIIKELEVEDIEHCAYISTQTAITCYMNKHQDVGIKIGWINNASHEQLKSHAPLKDLKGWDELKFDRWYETVCIESPMQNLYTKAGLKQPKTNKRVRISEACPYTAFPNDQRYVIQTQDKKDINSICPMQKRVEAHWAVVAKVCSTLMEANLVNGALLPKECIEENNETATVTTLLNHWSNALTL